MRDRSTKSESVKQANATLLDTVTAESMEKTFSEWKTERSKDSMFVFIMNYLHRVKTILHFVAASRNVDLELHLQAPEALSKLFFAYDRIKYKRLWPRYTADMQDLRMEHPNTWTELASDNVSVTRNAIPLVQTTLVSILTRVQSGLIGISNNANARQRFFMATPELSCLSRGFKDQFVRTTNINTEHPGLTESRIR